MSQAGFDALLMCRIIVTKLWDKNMICVCHITARQPTMRFSYTVTVLCGLSVARGGHHVIQCRWYKFVYLCDHDAQIVCNEQNSFNLVCTGHRPDDFSVM